MNQSANLARSLGMEEFVKKQRVRSVAIGTQRLHELRHAQMQALEVIGPSFGGFHVHVVARRAANIADTGLVTILVEDRHFPGRVAEDRAPDFLRPRHYLRRMLGRVRGIVVATAT